MERFWESTPIKGVLEFEASRDYFSEEVIITLKEKTEGIYYVFPTCDCKQGVLEFEAFRDYFSEEEIKLLWEKALMMCSQPLTLSKVFLNLRLLGITSLKKR